MWCSIIQNVEAIMFLNPTFGNTNKLTNTHLMFTDGVVLQANDATETFYLVKGRVKIYPDNSSEYVEVHAGDLVVLPKGMSYTWDVVVAVDKYYKFDQQ